MRGDRDCGRRRQRMITVEIDLGDVGKYNIEINPSQIGMNTKENL